MNIPAITVQDTKTLLESATPVRLIDVREPDEWELCRIPGAELIPLSQWPSAVSEKLTDPAQPLVIHCHHGGRSARAVDYLLRNGFSDVKNLTGGIDAWSQEIDPGVPRY
ncbi:MAG: rhodanese-like domain-containing protein [Verrucomicrobiota bacterium]